MSRALLFIEKTSFHHKPGKEIVQIWPLKEDPEVFTELLDTQLNLWKVHTYVERGLMRPPQQSKQPPKTNGEHLSF